MRIALVMAGGGGSRLWPASTPGRPKQFLALGDDASRTLLTAAVERAAVVAGHERTFIVTTAELESTVRAATPTIPAENLIAEPTARSTGPCVALALLHVVERLRRAGWSEGQIDATPLVVLPSDHHIGDEPRFAALLLAACDCAARTNRVLVLGATPTRAETGYGYIERDAERAPECADLALYPALRFVEKPVLARAREFLASGRFLWNAGVTVAAIGRLVDEYRRHAPAMWHALRPVGAALRDGSSERAAACAVEAYAAIPSTSIDVAILERLADLQVVATDVAWTDLGSWAAIREALPHDERGNATHVEGGAQANLLDSDGGLVWSDGPDITVIGLAGVAVIACGGRVLVCPLERAQEVRAAAEADLLRRSRGA